MVWAVVMRMSERLLLLASILPFSGIPEGALEDVFEVLSGTHLQMTVRPLLTV